MGNRVRIGELFKEQALCVVALADQWGLRQGAEKWAAKKKEAAGGRKT